MSQEKVALITGGSRGIGQAIVEKFQSSGWKTATCATQKESLANTKADIAEVCDVTHPKQVDQLISKTLEKLGRIDVLVNNAGLAGKNPVAADASDELWHRIIDVNLNGTYYFCKKVAPHLPDREGRIVNIASVLALLGVPDQTAYSAAKHAVLGFTRAFSQVLAPRGIPVNAVCPGWTKTRMAEHVINFIGSNEEEIAKTIPLGRLVQPEEIADFVFYLCASPGARMITGQSLTIDGGTIQS